MINYDNFEAWFITGSQHLYGEETVRQVAEDSKEIAKTLSKSAKIPVKVAAKTVCPSSYSI
jgi:L-arabinose isomerase